VEIELTDELGNPVDVPNHTTTVEGCISTSGGVPKLCPPHRFLFWEKREPSNTNEWLVTVGFGGFIGAFVAHVTGSSCPSDCNSTSTGELQVALTLSNAKYQVRGYKVGDILSGKLPGLTFGPSVYVKVIRVSTVEN
jgi:hypothetical protein